jgi:antitoxin component YwqK of YwqJK toxin-antitoxin module
MYIIKYGQDIEGNSVNLFAINSYYQNSKLTSEKELKKILSLEIESNSTQDIQDNEIFEVVEKLTKRNEKEIQNAFRSLIESDKLKIENICRNYHKLKEYSQLMGTHEFSELIEKEAGRKLSESQIQHAANSIKKTKTYVESILDGSFVPKGKHGINHVKHNLEYGFQLMGIIRSKRRKIIIDNNTSKVI